MFILSKIEKYFNRCYILNIKRDCGKINMLYLLLFFFNNLIQTKLI